MSHPRVTRPLPTLALPPEDNYDYSPLTNVLSLDQNVLTYIPPRNKPNGRGTSGSRHRAVLNTKEQKIEEIHIEESKPLFKQRKGNPAWVRGKTQNAKGRPQGSKSRMTLVKVRILARTGMLPLDFMTAVFRDELYDDYMQRVAKDGRTTYWVPAPQAKKIPVELSHRLAAATSAAPYIHKKMPVGIEVGNRNATIITADKLRNISSEELANLLDLMDRMGVGAEFEGHKALTFNEDGEVA